MAVDRFILASASPRRRALLEEIGIRAVSLVPRIDESRRNGERPRDLVLRLAEEKGRWARRRLHDAQPPALILAADTAVVIDETTLGKPVDRAHAERMLRTLRGRAHEVLTGVFLLRTDDARFVIDLETTKVTFREFDDRMLEAYLATGEPMDKAGAYGIQGGGAQLAASIEGSWANVVGLPVERLAGWLGSLGITLDDLRQISPRSSC